MTALVVSAVLTSDQLHPGRAFCPLAEACAAASKSDLGSFYGIPTSVLGMIAFGGLFALTLLPVEWARPLLRPAGLFAAFAGLGFIAYQYLALDAFCPLCLVADGAGFLAGMITLTWPQPPILRTGRRLPGEPMSAAVAWTLGAMLVTMAPFAWPRTEAPAWVEIAPLEDAAFAEEAIPEAAPAPEAVIAVAEEAPQEDAAPRIPGVTILASATPTGPEPERTAAIAAIAAPTLETAPVTEVPPAAEPAAGTSPTTDAAPQPAARSRTPVASAPAAPEGPLLVEYLNAFCPHCRKTLKRLEEVLDTTREPIRKRRVYTWASNDYPLWARACAHAQSLGQEETLFQQLLKARGQSRQEVFAAARRAGMDLEALRQALADPAPPARLVRDRGIVQRANIRMLPTIDIGRRRLQGEQSASELREAVQVATQQYAAKSQ